MVVFEMLMATYRNTFFSPSRKPGRLRAAALTTSAMVLLLGAGEVAATDRTSSKIFHGVSDSGLTLGALYVSIRRLET